MAETTKTLREALTEMLPERSYLGDDASYGYDASDMLDFALAALADLAQAEPHPVLVRDLAEILGSDVPTVCKALDALGRPPRSTNMAVGGEEALAVAAYLKLAQAQAEPVAVPDGFALVPVEPTPEMTSDGGLAQVAFGDGSRDYLWYIGDAAARACWAAMLAAAPKGGA